MATFIIRILLVALTSACLCTVQGQRILPSPIIQGQAGENISIACESTVPDRANTNELQIFRQDSNSFVSYEGTPDALMRLSRQDSNGSFSNFTFGPLTANDNGTVFRCASSLMASGNSIVSVIFVPIIQPVDNVFEQTEGMSYTFRVTISANPAQLTEFFWTKDAVRVSASSRINVSATFIQFTPVLRQDVGLYTLTVRNSLGPGTFSFNLTVRFTPLFSAVEPVEFNCTDLSIDYIMCASYPGFTGRLPCSADGYPVPTVSAMAQGVTQLSNVNLTTSPVTITSVVQDNAGNYTCTATNSEGEANRLIQFFVGGAPLPLTDVNLTKVGDNVNVVFMYIALNKVPVTDFFYMLIRNDTNEVRLEGAFPGNATYFNISVAQYNYLRGDRDITYKVSVTVRNIQGNSTAVSDYIIVNGAVVVSASSLLSLLFCVAVMLFY